MSLARSALVARVTLAAAVLAEAVLVAVICNHWHPVVARDVLAFEAPAAALFILAVAAFARAGLSVRAGVLTILGVAILLNALAILGPPTTSDDDFRYAWDAKVQLSGTDPYRYTPADPALVPLRDSFDFPAESPCINHPLPDGNCTQINRPTVHTIYPPVAQAIFVSMRLLSFGGHGNHLPLQLAEVLASLLTTGLLIRWALREGSASGGGGWMGHSRLWTAALWAWCPLTVLELANDAHVEGFAVLFSLAGLLAARRGRATVGGLWVGAAIATKLYPALLLPAIMRRHPGRVLGAALGLVALSYVPHVAAVGGAVIGYLPGYLQEGDYLSGGRFMLLNLMLPESVSPVIAVGLLGLLALRVWRRGDPERPELGALGLVGAFFLLATPNLSWYSLLLLGLAALTARPEWLGVVAAPTVVYLGAKLQWDIDLIGPLSYGVGALILLVGVLLRERARTAPSEARRTGFAHASGYATAPAADEQALATKPTSAAGDPAVAAGAERLPGQP